MSKGSDQRKSQVLRKQYNDNHDRIFRSKSDGTTQTKEKN